MSNEIPEIEACVCGIYPDVRTYSKDKNLGYFINIRCASECTIVVPESAKFKKFSECVHNWNDFIKQQKFNIDTSVSEKYWKEKTYEEYLEARTALIRLQTPFSVHSVSNEKRDKAVNILYKFFSCKFL